MLLMIKFAPVDIIPLNKTHFLPSFSVSLRDEGKSNIKRKWGSQLMLLTLHGIPHQSLLEEQGFRVGFQYNVCTINQFPTYRLRIFVTGVSTEKALSDAGIKDILILYDSTIVQEGADHADKIDDLAK